MYDELHIQAVKRNRTRICLVENSKFKSQNWNLKIKNIGIGGTVLHFFAFCVLRFKFYLNMHISWHGQYTVKIGTKDTTLILDPYAPETGLPAFRAKADVVALSNPADKSMSHLDGIQGEPAVVDSPGEYSLKGLTLYAFPWRSGDEAEKSLHRWDIDGVSLLHLGSLNRDLTDAELSNIERTDIDVLLLPVGGGSGLSTEKALAIVTQIEPRVVIPINFSLPGLKEKLNSVDKFAKEMGVNPSKKEKKVIIKSSKLPHEDMQTIILQP